MGKTVEEEKPKMQEPDSKAHQEALAKVQDQIDAKQKEAQALTAKITERSAGKEDFYREKAEIKAELDEVQGQMNHIKAQKDSIQASLGDKKAEGQTMKAELSKMTKNMKYTSEAEIDDRIATIEFKLWTESITLKEEKTLLAEIKDLKKNKPKLSELSKLQSNVENFDHGTNLQEKRNELRDQMAILHGKKTQIQEKMKALNEKRQSQVGDMSEVMEQREAVQKKIAELVGQRSTLRDEFRQAQYEYKAWQAEQRRIRQEKYQEERKEQEKAWKLKKMEKEVEKLDENPYVSPITMIKQTVKFCKGLLPQEAVEQKEEKKDTVFNNKDGEVVLSKKEDRADEWYFCPTKKKGGPKKGKASGDESKKPIKHNAETFKLFDTLGLEAPITVADVPPLLEKLEQQIVACQEKVDAWEAQKEEMKQKILDGSRYEDLVKGDSVEEEGNDKGDEEKEEEDKADEEEKEEEK